MAPAHTRLAPAPLDDFDEEDLTQTLASPRTPQGDGKARPWRLVTLVGAAALLGMALLAWGGTTQGPVSVSVQWADGAVGLAEDPNDPCSQYPFISLDGVLHSNLGGQGPDAGDEGIVYSAKGFVPGQPPAELIVVVNASSTYKAGHAKYNGIHGKYGLITVQAGNEADFRFSVFDAATMEPKQFAEQEFTFFDLDQSGDNDNREYIQVANASQMWLTRNTEIEVTDMPGGVKQFMSSRHGSGSDNPRDPMSLTVQQKNRAVTLKFEDFSELTVTLGCTAGSYARYFMFVARPSLLCAQTVGDVHRGEDEVVPVTPTTPKPTASPGPSDAAHQDCLYVIPVINYCIPQAWKFWS